MRLTEKEKEYILQFATQIFGYNTKVYLFGSRAIETARGGDIDLLIIPPVNLESSEFFTKKIQFLVRVLDKIGEQKMDVIVKYPDDTRGIIQTAIQEGIQLC